MIYFQTDRGALHQGHVIDISQEMEPESVHCVITSPPYWGLRDYGIEGQVWDEIPDNCYECPQHNNGPCTICHCLGKEHVWADHKCKGYSKGQGYENLKEWNSQTGPPKDIPHTKEVSSQFCQHCNAWKGSLGLEPTPELFIQHIVQVFRGVKRVLHKSGTIWVNMGDCYASQGQRKHGGFDGRHYSGLDGARIKDQVIKGQFMGNMDLTNTGLKPKDLIGIPWRVALALQADGWYLRSAMPWVKRSAMPESATDRPASALEYMFLLSKSQHYFFDMDAVRVAHKEPWRSGKAESNNPHTGRLDDPNKEQAAFTVKNREYNPAGRNFRNTDLFYESIEPPHGMIFCGDELVGLDVNPQAMKEAHFATFPEKLVEPCLKAGTSEKGCCPECLAPWERIVEKDTPENYNGKDGRWGTDEGRMRMTDKFNTTSETIGWKPICSCYHPYEIVNGGRLGRTPCTVMDIFGGSGTVAVVAEKHRRNWILVELSSDYCQLAKDRIQQATKQRRLF